MLHRGQLNKLLRKRFVRQIPRMWGKPMLRFRGCNSIKCKLNPRMSYIIQFPRINNWHRCQRDNLGLVAGSQVKSGNYQQSIKVVYLLLWVLWYHLKMYESLCFSCFSFPAALNLGAGSAFIWFGFEVIVFLSHLSNYVTSRESKTGIAWIWEYIQKSCGVPTERAS